jgi:hypothetical protein
MRSGYDLRLSALRPVPQSQAPDLLSNTGSLR